MPNMPSQGPSAPDTPTLSRRRAVAAVAASVAAALAPALAASASANATAFADAANATGTNSMRATASPPPSAYSPINIILPRDYVPPLASMPEATFRKRLTRAVLDYVESAYAGRKLPLWGRKLDKIDLERRISAIVHWIVEGVKEHQSIYPVDPIWIAAQIMVESFFYEFAVSYAFAVGICQFIPSTARSYGMLCAADKPEHHAPPYKLPHQAASLDRYGELGTRISEHRKRFPDYRGVSEQRLTDLLKAFLENKPVPDAAAQLEYIEVARSLRNERNEARKSFKNYLEVNFEGRDIFDKADLAFLNGFDQRTTYRLPVPAMVHMLATALRARNGNILAAASAYHAGLGRTREEGVFEPYGCIPGISSTVSYVSRIVVNHHEILRRF